VFVSLKCPIVSIWLSNSRQDEAVEVKGGQTEQAPLRSDMIAD
jgi:hypothetical protein